MHFVDFILNSIPLLINFYAEKYLQDDYSNALQTLESEFNLPIPGTYDFIVVGGGTAGCVVAARLSEKHNVLLLEAGGNPPPAAAVPYFSPRVAADPTINHFFKSLPQTNASLYNKGIITNHLGKMLGGSGSHNDLIHSRGSPRDFDNWAAITNDPSWNYANVLKYFKKSEDFIGATYGPGNEDYYGSGGPIQVDTNVVPMLPLWFEAGRELGYEADDPNGFQRESFAPMNKATRNGRRSSSFTEYIQPIEQTRANLTVIRYATVSEILINDNKEAYGVAYTRHGIPQIAYATKEVVLSAGAYQSPLLLMKSGVGPVETLNDANIPVKIPLQAVGQNLGDHPALILSPFYVNDSSLFDRIDPSRTEEMLRKWHLTGEGTLGMLDEGPQCFIASSKAEPGWPDIWIAFVPHVMVGSEQQQVISFYIVNGRPKSRGSISLNATAYREGVRDDVQLALIDFKFLTHPEDVDVLVEGIKFALRIAEETNAFKSIQLTYSGVPDEACSAYEFRSDEYWKCHLYQRTLSWTHMVGTSSMGPENGSPDTSVVDPKFRVRGVEKLRVIDGGVMPAVVNANTNAPILMMAEKGADDILTFWETQ